MCVHVCMCVCIIFPRFHFAFSFSFIIRLSISTKVSTLPKKLVAQKKLAKPFKDEVFLLVSFLINLAKISIIVI